jgi:S-adenosylmethionine-diacylglycerol 3-amino-3-carboxypropyl transferase
VHFEKLNYSFANETTEIEFSQLAPETHSVFCIAGSGSRMTPLLAKNPHKMDVFDSSAVQLYMAELRYQAMKQLDYDQYLKLLGYRKAETIERISILNQLSLKPKNKDFWLKKNTDWQVRGFIFIGRWERKIQILRKVFYFFHFIDLKTVFIKNLPRAFPKTAWSLFCRVVLTEFVVRRLLYSGQSKYNLPQPFGVFLHDQFLNQLRKSQLDQEFFLQFLFCDELLSEKAWPLEAQKHIFEAVKTSTTEVRFVCQNLNEIKDFDYNFYSFSDCFSYLNDTESQNILNQIALGKQKSQGVIRYFMYHPHLNFEQFASFAEIDPNQDRVPIYKIISFQTTN